MRVHVDFHRQVAWFEKGTLPKVMRRIDKLLERILLVF